MAKKENLKIGNIIWRVKEVDIDDVAETEKNYKIANKLMEERFQASLAYFGLASTVVVNLPAKKGGKYPLVDGNSRKKKAKEAGLKKILISYPSRRLTPKEYTEMTKIFDLAAAGEIDMKSIQEDKGSTADFFKRFHVEPGMQRVLGKMGNKVNVKELSFPGGKKEGKNGKEATPQLNDVQMVNLFFSAKQEKWFRQIEEKYSQKIKAGSTTEFVYKSLLKLYK